MYIQHLSLGNFRSYARLELDLPARIHVFQGENAQGKTNLLEAIYYVATTKSPLASNERELIRWQALEDVLPYASLSALYSRAGQQHQLEITLVNERSADEGASGSSLRKQVRLDGVPRRAMDTVGQLTVVLFLPKDIAIVAGSPAERRRYLDIALCQVAPDYCRALARYNRVLTQRNALLKQIRERQARSSELNYWDTQLVELATTLLTWRHHMVVALNVQVHELYANLTGHEEHLAVNYQDAVVAKLAGEGQSVQVVGNEGEELYLAGRPARQAITEALQAARREEVARGMTVVGPHRDDLQFLIDGIDATIYGSRGQQRTIALALKLAEVAVMHAETGEMPVLLLDDVLSELDRRRAQFLLRSLEAAEQALITTTNLLPYSRDLAVPASLWHVVAGTVQSVEQPPPSQGH